MDAFGVLRSPLVGQFHSWDESALLVCSVQRPSSGPVQEEGGGVFRAKASVTIREFSGLYVDIRDRLHLALEGSLGDGGFVLGEDGGVGVRGHPGQPRHAVPDEDPEEHKRLSLQHQCGRAGTGVHVSHHVPHFGKYRSSLILQVWVTIPTTPRMLLKNKALMWKL